MRQRLLESAARVVAEVGIERATIDDYLQAASISRGTFYNYYKTSEELTEDLWNTVGHDPFERIRVACSVEQDPPRRLMLWCQFLVEEALANPMWGWVVYAFSSEGANVKQELLIFPGADLDWGHREGRFRFTDRQTAVTLIVSSMRSLIRDVLLGRAGQTSATALGNMLLLALGVSAEEAQAATMDGMGDTYEKNAHRP
jgi:AcrR family transcriptional regulator